MKARTAIAMAASLGALPCSAMGELSSGEHAFFEKEIRPLLVKHCYECHSGTRTKGGLALDTREGLLKGGAHGATIMPGKPEDSRLITAVRQGDKDLSMPPRSKGVKLSGTEIAALEKWITMGAPDPRVAEAKIGGMSEAEARAWWAFQPLPDTPHRITVPAQVDAILDEKIRSAGITPAKPADRRTLIRRATYDLTGLPPTPAEVEAFLVDPAPDAYAKMVERLLASPQYGVKWGRHWLDVVRYADTAGENSDYPVPHAWRYRNWVVDAFNRDLPYDQFVRQQIAGDLTVGKDEAAAAEGIVATGYFAIARRFGHDSDKDMHLTYEDVIDNLGRNFLGLSTGCARCHDHKYDPMTNEDYYALYGIFESTRFSFPGCEAKRQSRDLVPLMPKDKVEALRQAKGSDAASLIPVAYAVAETRAKNARMHERGDPDKLGAEIPRRWLSVFGGEPVTADAGSGRGQLAGWIVQQPLAARVMVNRLWQHHFGLGLVRTPNDFGSRGERPSHPALLERLAVSFVAQGWSMKAMHRLIMNTAAYQRGSEVPELAAARDPENRMLAHFARRRLSAEEIRDSLLVAGGSLDASAGTAHPFPAESTWRFTQHNPFNAVYDSNKRSAYLMVQRTRRHPFLALFDGADPNASTAERQTTTVPTQALYFLNDPFFHAQSQKVATRMLGIADDEGRIAGIFRLLFQREASAQEQSDASAFLAAYASETPDIREQWAALARVLLAGNEFTHLD